MTQQQRHYTKTTPTADPDAAEINAQLDDVAKMINIGQELRRLLNDRFGNDIMQFRRWVRSNLDRDEKSIARYLTLAEHADLLHQVGIIRLSDAYHLLDLSGNVEFH